MAMTVAEQVPQYNDAVHVAYQLGRLDLLTAILACIAIILALGGVFAFLSIKSSAKKEARRVAKKIAQTIAETAANNYLQAKLPEILEAYREFIRDGVNEEVANQIALAQDNGLPHDE
jgi:uncharacterized protein HemX